MNDGENWCHHSGVATSCWELGGTRCSPSVRILGVKIKRLTLFSCFVTVLLKPLNQSHSQLFNKGVSWHTNTYCTVICDRGQSEPLLKLFHSLCACNQCNSNSHTWSLSHTWHCKFCILHYYWLWLGWFLTECLFFNNTCPLTWLDSYLGFWVGLCRSKYSGYWCDTTENGPGVVGPDAKSYPHGDQFRQLNWGTSFCNTCVLVVCMIFWCKLLHTCM